MRYKFTKTKRNGVDYTLVQTYSNDDGFVLKRLIEKHDPENKNVIIVKNHLDGLTEFSGIDVKKFEHFSSTENFEGLEWIDSMLDIE